MWSESRLPHALLVLGNAGHGGLPIVLAFVQYLFCKNKQAHDACGTCDECNRIAKLEHPDVHISFPSIPPKPNTKAMSMHFMKEFREFIKQHPYGSTFEWLQHIQAENKQGNITAEECRQIIETLHLKSYEGKQKVQIIWRPEYLGKEGNILLKLIEEPPANTYIFLVAEQTEMILPTILSRTQTVKLSPIDVADIAVALTNNLSIDSHKASQIAQTCNGSYAEALSLAQHSQNNLFPEVKRFFNMVFTNNRLEISKFVEQWSKAGREEQKFFLQYIIQLLGQAIRLSYLPSQNAALPPEDATLVQKLIAKKMPNEILYEMVEQLAATSYNIERNAHGKTQLHAMCIKVALLANGLKLPQWN